MIQSKWLKEPKNSGQVSLCGLPALMLHFPAVLQRRHRAARLSGRNEYLSSVLHILCLLLKTGWKVCLVSCWHDWSTCHLLAGHSKAIRLIVGCFSAPLLTAESGEAYCFSGGFLSASKWAVLSFQPSNKIYCVDDVYNCTATNLMAERLGNQLRPIFRYWKRVAVKSAVRKSFLKKGKYLFIVV